MNSHTVSGFVLGVTLLLGCCGNAAAQLNTGIQGQPVNGPLREYRHLGERDGYAGDRHGQSLVLNSRVVYQFQVRSYYYTPAAEIWDRDRPVAASSPLQPYYDERGYPVYISELAFRPYYNGDYYLRVNPGEGRARSSEYTVAVYGYVVDEDTPPPPEPPPEPGPAPEPPSPPQPSGPCTCPDGFEHWYGTVCVGINTPETAECR